MATYNPHNHNTNLLSSSISSISAISSQHYERNTTATTTTAFLLPAVASNGVTTSTAIVAPAQSTPLQVTPLHLDTFVTGSPHFMTHHQQQQQQQQQHHHQHHQHQQQQQQHHTTNATSSTSSYTLVQIKREPCQVSEVTSATNSSSSSSTHHHQQLPQHTHHHQQQQQQQQQQHSSSTTTTHHSISSGCSSSSSAMSATSKTMASSSSTTSSSTSATLTTLVKLEPPSPKIHDMDKSSLGPATLTATTSNTNSSVPIGIAVARKRPQESNTTAMGNANSMPMQQTMNKDMNCFGIRVADLSSVGTGCGNFYFTGNGDLMTTSTTAEEFALSAAAQSVNRAPSTFWQYPNTLPIESVISMSPATVGLQYSREASRGVVLLPATAAALDPFQQAAAAFVWPSYIPQSSAPATLQPPPNFIFPSMSSHSTLQAPSYATPLQLFGPNYLTAAAAAAAAAAATSTLCQHSQQQTTISAASTNGLGRFMNTTTTSTDMQKSLLSSSASGSSLAASSTSSTKHMMTNSGLTMSLATAAAAAAAPPLTPLHTLQPHPPTTSLILPPHAMKLEDWNTDFMSAAITKSSGGSLHSLPPTPMAHSNATPSSLIVPAATATGALHVPPPPPMTMLHNGHTGGGGLLDLGHSSGGALNLIRLPTPPSSATIESAAAAAVAPQLQPHLLFHPATSTASPTVTTTPATLLNLTVTTTATPHATNLTRLNGTPANSNGFVHAAAGTPTIGPPTPLAEELPPINFKTDQQIVVGVPRDVATTCNTNQQVAPQMQDVNIQTDTPVCSEDENSSCPLAIQQQQQSQQIAMANTNGHFTTSVVNQSPVPALLQVGAINNNNNLAGAGQSLGENDADVQQPLELTKPVDGRMKLPNVETTSSEAAAAPVGSGGLECHRREDDKTNGGFSETSPLKDNNNHKCVKPSQQPVSETPVELTMSPTVHPSATTLPVINNNNNSDLQTLHQQQQSQATAEDLTGLELLSNISASTLAKTSTSSNVTMMRIKQEPLEHVEMLSHTQQQQQHDNSMLMPDGMQMSEALVQQQQTQEQQQQPVHPSPPVGEVFGGLSLLCALAEQRIQEEVQTSGLFATATPSPPLKTDHDDAAQMHTQRPAPLMHATSFPGFHQPAAIQSPSTSSCHAYRREHSFPSMDSIELPTTSSAGLTGSSAATPGAVAPNGDTVKRKKHKHSKTSKTATSSCVSLATLLAPASTSVASSAASSSSSPTKKTQRCSKKNKKKYTKEKHHKHHARDAADAMDLDDEQLQEDLKNAFNSVDPTYVQRGGKLPDAHEIINMVESSMRMRLADITRQYRKKKRKLDEISKSKMKLKKKKKKCSKWAALQEQNNAAATTASCSSALTLGGVANGVNGSVVSNASTAVATTTAARCDYNFTKFANASSAGVSVVSSTYLHNASFQRFGDKSSPLLPRTPFPPPPASGANALAPTGAENGLGNSLANEMACPETTATPCIPAYKPVRLEPSALAAAEQTRASGSTSSSSAASTSVMRLAAKHSSSEKLAPATSPKERKLCAAGKSRRSSGPDEQPKRKPHPLDREVMLTGEHLYRKETRVLTDMGGLFYAGVLKPLQPPDVYAITLDGERGNKSHIMSREEIFKDTILEITPKSKDVVPVGTRLCAYWSQQYRCLYPGRAIESESSEDDDDASSNNDFVSVEFDDGDSGRIRLQNIRLLLSDYPIVEYNENPLSTLGKQKKSSLGVGAFRSPSDQKPQDGAGTGARGDEPSAQSLDSKQLLLQQLEMRALQQKQQEAREVYAAKRIERKLKKSMKKKQTQQASANSAATSTATATPATPNGLASSQLSVTNASLNGSEVGSAVAGPANGDFNDLQRKHHKHKKHKKHKKQRHHRKALATAQLAAAAATTNAADDHQPTTNGAAYVIKRSMPFVGKQEIIDDNDVDDDEDDDEDDDDEDGDDEVPVEQNAFNKTPKVIYANGSGGAIKQELTNGGGGVRVKTEHLDYEEETASNLMSEVSDELKGDDEIEHKNSKGSKIAAFLPDRQLWGWLGKAYRKAGVKGRARKQFYKTINRGKEMITVGDCAVFLSTGRPDRPYIGRIESMWETTSSNKVVRVRWFYHPEETKGCPDLKYPGALFESPHEDENDVQTISHYCEVLPFERYFSKFGSDSKQYQSIYDNNDTYYLAGSYNPRAETLKLQPNIPTLAEQSNCNAIKTTTTTTPAIKATTTTTTTITTPINTTNSATTV